MRKFVIACVLAAAAFGCSRSPSLVLGQPPDGPSRTVASLRTVMGTERIVVRGSMIEKCPVAGCWFRLRDETGVIKVDTRGAGFVVTKVPVHCNVVVSGKVVADGDSLLIQATGIRY
jgi:uncharacterized protein YdeI (BOF family)